MKTTMKMMSAIALIALCTVTGAAAAAAPATTHQGTDMNHQESSISNCALEVSGIRSPCRIDWPQGQPLAAVVLIPGSLFLDVDGNLPLWQAYPNTYRDLAAMLARRGYVVLRYAKPGPQTGSETTDMLAAARHLDFAMRVNVAAAALAQLRTELDQRGLEVGRWLIAGHSEGALVASMLAQRETALAGVISLAGPALRIFDIMRQQIDSAPPPGTGLPHAQGMQAFDAVVATLRQGGALPASAAAHPYTAMFAMVGAAGVQYLQSEDAVDPLAQIARVRQSTLLVQGMRDTSVSPEQVDALAAARAGLPTTVARFPELQHFFKYAPAGTSAMQSFALNGETDEQVAVAIDGWIRELK